MVIALQVQRAALAYRHDGPKNCTTDTKYGGQLKLYEGANRERRADDEDCYYAILHPDQQPASYAQWEALMFAPGMNNATRKTIMSDVAGALARSGFEKAENEKNAFSSSGRPERERTAGGGETTASVASAVFARGAEDAFGAARETTAFVSSATDLSELDDVASVSESSRDARGGGDDDDDAFVGRTR